MDVSVADNPTESRFELHADGELAGFAAYHRSQGQIAFTHTEVDDAYEGQGLGSRLAATALDAAREEGLAVLPSCPFIRGYIAEHDEYVDLVPESERGDSRCEEELQGRGDHRQLRQRAQSPSWERMRRVTSPPSARPCVSRIT